MRTKLILTLGLIVSVFTLGVGAASADVTDSVSATASIAGIETMSLVTKNVADNAVSVPAKTLSFGAVSGAVSSPQYIEVAYASNETLWKISVYTNNTTANATELPYAKAGMLKSDGKDRIPLYWCVYDETATPEALTLDANGVPVLRTPSQYPVSTNPVKNKVTDWSVMKDKNDLNDPKTPFDDKGTGTHDDDTGLNESWQYAFEGGYCDIMYGAPSYSNLNAVPYYDVAPETTGTFVAPGSEDNTIARPATSPAIVYVGAGAGFSSAGSYSTTISFDLYHE